MARKNSCPFEVGQTVRVGPRSGYVALRGRTATVVSVRVERGWWALWVDVDGQRLSILAAHVEA